jgi:hypothetical protein
MPVVRTRPPAGVGRTRVERQVGLNVTRDERVAGSIRHYLV